MTVRYIYGLYDPRKPDLVMVVGETKCSFRVRLQSYINSSRRGKPPYQTHKWVLKLLADGIRPGIRLLATTDDRNWRRTERRFISIWRKKNPGLLNVHRGGNGSEDKKRKTFCDKCGTRRKQGKNGLYCRKCSNAYQRDWKRTPKRQAHQRAYMRAYNSRIRARRRDYQRTPEYLAWRRDWRRTPKRRAYDLAYNRDHYHAKKLNLTVAEYRAQRKRPACR